MKKLYTNGNLLLIPRSIVTMVTARPFCAAGTWLTQKLLMSHFMKTNNKLLKVKNIF